MRQSQIHQKKLIFKLNISSYDKTINKNKNKKSNEFLKQNNSEIIGFPTAVTKVSIFKEGEILST